MDWRYRLNYKHITIGILKLLISFVIVLFVFLCWNIDISNLNRNEFDSSVDVIGMSGIDDSTNIWVTTDCDPSITVDYAPGSVIVLDIDFTELEESVGVIYYADVPEHFSESRTLTYLFKSGENIIRINDDYAEYLRLDITNDVDVRFEMNSFHKESSILYFFQHANYIMICFLAVSLVVLYELIRYSKTNAEKTSCIFWVIMGVTVFCVFGEFITGASYYMYTGVGADTINQYYPYYLNEVISIREGTSSIWNWNYGLGTSLLNNVAWTFDPFGILIVLAGVIFGPGCVQYLIVWMQIVKILVLFALGKKYLSYVLRDELAINLSAYILAFNGYIMLWGQHYFLGTACVFAVLFLCAIEYFIYNDCNKGGWTISLSVAWILLFSYYIGYMILVVCAIYFLFRYFTIRKRKHIKEIFSDLWHCLFSVISGILASGIIFIPACYYVMTNSSRLNNSDSGMLEKLWSNFTYFNEHDVAGRFSRMMSNNLLCIEDSSKSYFANYYEAPQLFCTIFIFFFFGQWIVYEIKTTKEKKTWATMLTKLALIMLMIFNSATGLILNAFAYASFRYTYLLFPFFSLCVGIVFQEVIHRKQISFFGIIIGATLSLGTLAYSYKLCSLEVLKYVGLVGILLLAGATMLLVMWRNNKLFETAFVCFTGLVIVSTALDGWYTTCNRNKIDGDNFSLQWEDKEVAGDTAEAVAWIESQDASFYRLGKTYCDWNEFGDSIIEGYSSIAQYNSTLNTNVSQFYDHIYMNSNTSFYAIKLFKLDTELDQRANDIVNTKYLLSKSPIENENWTQFGKVGEVIIYKNNNSDSVAKWYTNTISKQSFEQLSDDDKAQILQNTVVVEEEYAGIGSSKAVIGDFYLEKQTEMVGEIECTGDGILMIAVPDQEGWELYVNDKPVETINCNYGFKGVYLEKGDYKLNLKYSFPSSNIGIMSTIIGSLMIITIILYEKKHKGTKLISAEKASA